MAGIGVKHLDQGIWWREAAWQHHEEEVGPDASPGTCLDLEGAARAPHTSLGERQSPLPTCLTHSLLKQCWEAE